MTAEYIRSVDGRWGKVHFIEKDEYVGKSLYNYGEYVPGETELLLSLARKAGKHKLILDIGSNIGVIAQALASNGYRVEAFEPQPVLFEILKMNFGGNCHNVAVGREHGKAVMPLVSYDEPNNFGALQCGFRSPLGGFEVRVIPIDSLGHADVGLMKIDVEEEVLRGARETIARCNPIIYLEDDRPKKSASLHRYLKRLGFRWVRHTPPLFRSANFFGNKKNVWNDNYVSRNLLCYRINRRQNPAARARSV